MVELGFCIGRCTNTQRCFFVKSWFMCSHLCCYNLAIKYMLCIQCGNNKIRYHMTDNREEVIMNHKLPIVMVLNVKHILFL